MWVFFLGIDIAVTKISEAEHHRWRDGSLNRKTFVFPESGIMDDGKTNNGEVDGSPSFSFTC